MKKLVMLTILLIFSTVSYAQEQLLVITDPWPPYIIDENDQQGGFEYDITEEILKTMGYTMKYKSYPWNRVLHLIKNKEADAVLGIFKNTERQQYMFFPDEAFVNTSYVLFHKKNDKFRYDGISSLNQKQIGIIGGYVYGNEFDNADNFTKQSVPTVKQNIEKLLKNRIDLFTENRLVGMYIVNKMGYTDKISPTTTPIDDDKPHYIAFSMKNGHDKLAKKFAAALKEFKQTQRFTEILNKYGL